MSIMCSAKVEIINHAPKLEEQGISVYPVVLKWTKKGLGDVFDQLIPDKFDIVSVQFVPYSFNVKGLPFTLAQGLKNTFVNTPFHINFHELWLGMEIKASVKSRYIGLLQKRIIHNLLKELQPKVITTNTLLYQYQLRKMGFDSYVLPLYSNITKFNFSDEKSFCGKLTFVFFGSLHGGAPAEDFISELLSVINTIGKVRSELQFVFVGNNGSYISEWLAILKSYKISYRVTGKISEQLVSKYLASADYGITTTPFLLTEKSGTVAAMLQHGLKIICVAKDWQVNGFDSTARATVNPVQHYKRGNLGRILKEEYDTFYNDIDRVSGIYANLLKF